jgi:tetratricopeptide (TPR) repeat protein
MIRRLLTLAVFATVGLAGPRLDAQHGAAKPNEPMAPLMDGLGAIETPITTADPMAQAYFNQGLRLIYAFNHDEAIKAFRAAETIDPDCAMAQWGSAVALGPNYNLDADPEKASTTIAALRKAQQLVKKATPREQAYVEALSKRYSEDPKADRKALDRAYAEAMDQVAARFPDDLEAQVLSAEALMQLRPWDLWTADGSTPMPGTERILAKLEQVLARNPNHTGAHHYYIHACEASQHPERALESARRMGGLAPKAGHLVHMPAHIYFRLGMYEDAARSNELAIIADEDYIAKRQPTGPYPMMYYPHNIHFLWAAQTMDGQSAAAIKTATRTSEKLRPEMVKDMAEVEYFLPVRWYALTRFQKHQEMLDEPAPPDELGYARGMWHYGRGKAYCGLGNSRQAEAELAALTQRLVAMPQDRLLMRHSLAQLLAIARHDLAADIALATRKPEGIAELRTTVMLQDQLLYDEPPPWFKSQREALAKALLAAGQAGEAEAVARADLERCPNSGWTLFLLEKSLRAQRRTDEADAVAAEFKKCWQRADFQLE